MITQWPFDVSLKRAVGYIGCMGTSLHREGKNIMQSDSSAERGLKLLPFRLVVGIRSTVGSDIGLND